MDFGWGLHLSIQLGTAKWPFQGSGTGSWHIRCPPTPTRVLYCPSQSVWQFSPIKSVGVRGQHRDPQLSTKWRDFAGELDLAKLSSNFSMNLPGLWSLMMFDVHEMTPSDLVVFLSQVPQLLQAGRSGRAGETLLPLAVPQPGRDMNKLWSPTA